ncbi:uncharacterized protein J3R85_015722 [Psidium guajava]|nr:uncharacterized protein J3R85_015722 [Psidium guajava]
MVGNPMDTRKTESILWRRLTGESGLQFLLNQPKILVGGR